MANEQKEECISQVVQSFHEISMQNEDVQLQNISAICKLYDTVINTLSVVDTSTSRIHCYILGLRLHETNEEKKHIQKFLPLEADLYRCVLLTSIYLLEKMPLVAPISDGVKQALGASFKRSQALLNFLERIYLKSLNEHEEISLPTDHPLLDQWISKLKPHDGNDNDAEISFDREQLQMEESELLQMAATPTPYETGAANQLLSTSDPIARLITKTMDSSTNTPISIAVSLNDEGVFRPRDTSSPDLNNTWWMITCNSKIAYDSPMFTIHSVISNHESSDKLSCCAMKLNVGKDGTLWWEKVSRIVHQLQEAKDLQGNIQQLWPEQEFRSQLEQARIGVCVDSTALN